MQEEAECKQREVMIERDCSKRRRLLEDWDPKVLEPGANVSSLQVQIATNRRTATQPPRVPLRFVVYLQVALAQESEEEGRWHSQQRFTLARRPCETGRSSLFSSDRCPGHFPTATALEPESIFAGSKHAPTPSNHLLPLEGRPLEIVGLLSAAGILVSTLCWPGAQLGTKIQLCRQALSSLCLQLILSALLSGALNLQSWGSTTGFGQGLGLHSTVANRVLLSIKELHLSGLEEPRPGRQGLQVFLEPSSTQLILESGSHSRDAYVLLR